MTDTVVCSNCGSIEDTPPAPTEDELRKVAHKAAEIGFTYGALGRDFTFAYKNVEDLLNNPERAKP